MKAFIGHYAAEGKVGIKVIDVDETTGKLSDGKSYCVRNAVWMISDRKRNILYVCQARDKFGAAGKDGGIVAYSIGANYELEEIDAIATKFTAPCHAALSPNGDRIAWAEYSNATVGAVRIGEDGKFVKETFRLVQHSGKGFSQPRQDRAHAHCVAFTPDGYLCAVDLGIDQVKTYMFSGDDIFELKDRVLHFEPGTGPRHIIFGEDGKRAFVISELSNRLFAFRYEAGLKFIKTDELSTLSDDVGCNSIAAAVKLSKDGKEIYCSNRGYDSIAVFGYDCDNGKLVRRAILPLAGKVPRDFGFFGDEKYAIVCFQDSGCIRSYRYDRENCRFSVASNLEYDGKPLFVSELYA